MMPALRYSTMQELESYQQRALDKRDRFGEGLSTVDTHIVATLHLHTLLA